jgi:hypothetical protein
LDLSRCPCGLDTGPGLLQILEPPQWRIQPSSLAAAPSWLWSGKSPAHGHCNISLHHSSFTCPLCSYGSGTTTATLPCTTTNSIYIANGDATASKGDTAAFHRYTFAAHGHAAAADTHSGTTNGDAIARNGDTAAPRCYASAAHGHAAAANAYAGTANGYSPTYGEANGHAGAYQPTSGGIAWLG